MVRLGLLTAAHRHYFVSASLEPKSGTVSESQRDSSPKPPRYGKQVRNENCQNSQRQLLSITLRSRVAGQCLGAGEFPSDSRFSGCENNGARGENTWLLFNK